MFGFFGLVVGSAFRTAIGRARRGPLRPTWSFGFETIVGALKSDWERLRHWPIERVRAEMEARNFPSDAARKVTREKVSAGVKGEWVRPPSARPRQSGVVLYVHGGSYLFGSPDTHVDTTARIALATGCDVFALDYRLAPEHRFPAQQDDALATISWLESQGITRDRIVIAGESAGGNLVLSVLLALRDRNERSLRAGVMISPWLDLRATGESFERNHPFDYGSKPMLLEHARLVAGDRALDDPNLSVGLADPTGIAPVLVQVGTAELLYDQCERWADKARLAAVNVQWDAPVDMPHAPPFFAAQSPEGAKAVETIGAYIRAALR